MTKIFLTGATGYIGGDVLSVLATKHPDFSISALIRSPEKAQQVQAQFPSLRIVHGGLDDSDLLEKESAAADIVLHTADASDHVDAAKAIAAGLAAGHSTDKPGYWLHTGGTGILTFADTDRGVFGDRDGKVYDDWDGVEELTHLPDHAFHRNVDQIVLDAGAKDGACVSAYYLRCVFPVVAFALSRVYKADAWTGRGRGPCSQRSRQAYELARVTIQLQKGPIIGVGQSVWNKNNVHVHDLSDLFVLLVEAAVQGRADDGLWGGNAYYLAENGEHSWDDLAREMAKRAAELGYIPCPVAESINPDDAKKYAGFESLSWGMNSRGRARRARNLLGWKPSRPSLEAEVPAILKDEWETLQK